DHAHGGRLARAVGAEQPDDLPGGHLEGDVAHGPYGAEPLADSGDDDHVKRGKPPAGAFSRLVRRRGAASLLRWPIGRVLKPAIHSTNNYRAEGQILSQ